MTATDRLGSVRRSPRAFGRLATARLRLAVRALIAFIVVLAVVASAAAASPVTTLLLGGFALAWLLLSFEVERPPEAATGSDREP